MATIKDVARLAGVSVATVSRVLNGEKKVLPETKLRVTDAIEKLSYSPNLLGRNLRRGATKCILVLLYTISNPFYSRVVRGIEERAAANGYSVMLYMTHGDAELERRAVTLLQTKLIDGAIFLSSEQVGEVLTEACRGIPVVQACEPQTSFLAASVAIDNRRAAFEAVSYLIRRGHERIVFFGAGEMLPSSIERRIGYCDAMRAAGYPVLDTVEEGFSLHAGMRAAERLLASEDALPHAVFCISDSCAAGAARTFMKAGLRVPEDISVMGFDNAMLSEAYWPGITTVRQPRYEIGYTAADLLLAAIEGEDNRAKKIVLSHELVERESVNSRKEE